MKIAGVGICTRAPRDDLRGLARWRALADAALDDLGMARQASQHRRDVPIFIGSCNGAADDMDAASWSSAFADLGELPVASAACASGLHALWLAATRLADGPTGLDRRDALEPAASTDEVIVLAVDTISRASHANFAALRVLDDSPSPWQPTSQGFREGEAAVALRLVRGDGAVGTRVVGPLLGDDNLAELVRALGGTPDDVDFIVGQGTGPAIVDEQELAALPPGVPLATALVQCGHTIGASGLLSVAAVAANRFDLLAMHATHVDATHPMATNAMDGRPLGVPARRDRVLVACRALGGATAVVRLETRAATSDIAPSATRELRHPSRWVAPQEPPPLRLPLLRRIAALPRPDELPAVIVVRLDAPLVPPEDARIGGKLLPSVVLEITPGFIAQLLARTWGFAGPALTLVGGSDAGWVPTLASIRRVHGAALVLHVHARDFDWA